MEVTGTVERARCWQTVSFDWKIKDFSQFLARAPRSFYYSSPFRLGGHTWILELYIGDSDSISLSLWWFREQLPDFETPYSLGIRLASGKTVMDVAGTRTICGDDLDCMHLVARKTIKRSELFRRREELLPLDVLTVTVTLKGNSVAEDAIEVEGNRGRKRQRTDGEDERLEKAGTERVLQDIGKMWPSDEHSDVVFRVKEKEFKAHRAILSARIPALGAMFRHDTAEKASGLVTIDDCEPAIFEQLLHYVYRGVPREVTAENACPLFTVADKYLVREVKTLCVRYMRAALCVETFCNTVTLALMHREDELLETAVYFFNRKMLDIVQSVQWQTFLRDHSTWANEILIRAAKIWQVKKT